jgi:D-glycero-D-manno-heptose 1,7-bisphosphate phosphatase
VFLDKDGTLVPDRPYSVEASAMHLARGAAEGCRALHSAGYALVCVSNQSGVARGLFGEDALGPVRDRLDALLDEQGVPLLDFLYCPHHPEGSVAEYTLRCDCRKPRPGLLLDGAARHGIDLESSWMVGDILDDVEAGARAGCRTVLIDNGNETEWLEGEFRRPDFVARDLREAATLILSSSDREVRGAAV